MCQLTDGDGETVVQMQKHVSGSTLLTPDTLAQASSHP